MDVDAVIRRAPELALIDELAHTNLPEARNEKRWQDIEEVLAAGHRRHLDRQRPAPREPERRDRRAHRGPRARDVPRPASSKSADEVVLVDLTPEALQQRLRAGKVYAQERVDVALDNFFRADRLSALRELALREVAEDVGARRQAAVLDPLERAGGRRARARAGHAGAALPAHPAPGVAVRRAARRAARRALGATAPGTS